MDVFVVILNCQIHFAQINVFPFIHCLQYEKLLNLLLNYELGWVTAGLNNDVSGSKEPIVCENVPDKETKQADQPGSATVSLRENLHLRIQLFFDRTRQLSKYRKKNTIYL